MAARYKGIPEGASAVIPRLVCRNVEAQIGFCCEALGGVETLRRPGPDGRVAHAMLRFGPSMLMLESLESRPGRVNPICTQYGHRIALTVKSAPPTIDRCPSLPPPGALTRIARIAATLALPAVSRQGESAWDSHRSACCGRAP